MRGARLLVYIKLFFLNIDIPLAYDERTNQIKALNSCVKCDLSKSDLRKLKAKEASLMHG